MNLEQLKNKLKENLKLIKKSEDHPTLDEFQKSFRAQTENFKITIRFLSQLFIKATKEQKKTALQLITPNEKGFEKYESNIKQIISSMNEVREEYGNYFKGQLKSLKEENTTKTNSELLDNFVNDMISFTNDDEELKKINKKVASFFAAELNANTEALESEDKLNRLFDIISEIDVDLEEVAQSVETPKCFLDIEGDDLDVPTHKKDIDDLKEELDEYDDKEYINTLDDANKILTTADPAYFQEASSFLESFGSYVDIRRRDQFANYINQVEDVKNNVKFLAGGTSFTGDPSTQKKSDISKKIIKQEPIFNQNTIDGLNEVIDLIKDAGISSNELFEKHYDSKSGYRFGMTLLCEKKKLLQKAVEDANKSDIIKYTKEYRDVEKKYDNILSKIDQIADKDSTVSNNGNSREEDVPGKYRKAGVGVSKLNAMVQLIRICDKYGVDAKEFVANPYNGYRNIIKSVTSNFSTMNNLKNANSVYDMLDIIKTKNDVVDSKDRQCTALAIELSRVNDTLYSVLGGGQDNIEKGVSLSLYFNETFRQGLLFEAKKEDANFYDEDFGTDAEIINNTIDIIVAGKESNLEEHLVDYDKYVNYETLEPNKKTFKIDEYLNNKENQFKVIKNLMSADKYAHDFNLYNMRLIESIDAAVVKFKQVGYEKTEIVKDVLEKIEKNKTISKTDKLNIDLEQGYYETKNKGLMLNIGDGLKKYLEVKDAYASRSIFAKIFYSSVRRQSRFIDKIESDMLAIGVTKKELKNVYNANPTERENKINTIATRYDDNIDIVQNHNDIQIDNNDEKLEIKEFNVKDKTRVSEFNTSKEEIKKNDIEINTSNNQ